MCKKILKKLMATFLSAAMILCLLPAMTLPASAEEVINLTITAPTGTATLTASQIFGTADIDYYWVDSVLTAPTSGSNIAVVYYDDYSVPLVFPTGCLLSSTDHFDFVLSYTGDYKFYADIPADGAYPAIHRTIVISYSAAPTVTGISPTTGPTAGDTDVTIIGTNFTGATGADAVKFGSTNAADNSFTYTDTASGAWNGTDVASGFAGGSGTSGAPYQIATPAQLAYLAQLTNACTTDASNGGAKYSTLYYILTADIDLNSKPWTPIGTDDPYYFLGSFNGSGHTISNLAIGTAGSPSNSYLYNGLFGKIFAPVSLGTGAKIEGLGIVNASIYSGGYSSEVSGNAGALAGAIDTAIGITLSSITNCYATGSVCISGGDSGNAGGLVGSFTNSTMSGCYTAGSVATVTNGSAGGLIGTAYSSGSITSCYSTCSVSAVGGTMPVAGGLLG